MEIKDRIVKIITSEGLNSSAFADIVGVQRSSISHILSGRNKPSLDFLQKIITAFSKYNAEWLIVGTGDVYKIPKQSSIFDHKGVEPSNQEKSSSMNFNRNKEEAFINPLLTNKSTKQEGTSPESKDIVKNTTTIEEPTIDKIVVFYNDKTFTEYKPNKN